MYSRTPYSGLSLAPRNGSWEWTLFGHFRLREACEPGPASSDVAGCSCSQPLCVWWYDDKKLVATM